MVSATAIRYEWLQLVSYTYNLTDVFEKMKYYFFYHLQGYSRTALCVFHANYMYDKNSIIDETNILLSYFLFCLHIVTYNI